MRIGCRSHVAASCGVITQRKEVNVTRFTRIVHAHRFASPVSIFAVVVAATFALALTVGVSGTRAAASDCPSATLCLWHGTLYTSTQWNQNETVYPPDQWHKLGNAFDNAASLYNHRVNKAFVDETDNGPQKFCVKPGDMYSNLGNQVFPNGDKLAFNIGWFDLIDPGTGC
jgi:Peptidase inhibitor family I36